MPPRPPRRAPSPHLLSTSLRALGLALALLLPRAAAAQVDKQDNEVAANGSLFKALQGGPAFLTLAVHVGRLLHDVTLSGTKIEGLQVGGDVIFSGPLDFSGGASMTLFPAARIYFAPKDPRLTPYAGAGLGLTIYKASDVSFTVAYDLNGGVKYFLNPTTAAFGQLDLTGPLTSPGSSIILLSFGLAVFF